MIRLPRAITGNRAFDFRMLPLIPCHINNGSKEKSNPYQKAGGASEYGCLFFAGRAAGVRTADSPAGIRGRTASQADRDINEADDDIAEIAAARIGIF